ncbi:carbamoyltransferase [Yeosuana aromativorans]|uniref:Carbamoyltransferase n=1 Tax=Yeosuana aromativorans TaxID=288019 RepID=A0A8J3FI06_9FLAO|nr:carbamoyltransferase HypF [Yeosuana aromativorans]GGK27976.1 carbamoyltransferase [Yeosuana aromativorans]
MLKTYKILISGQVQGVGFRPYVFGLANSYNLTGTVSNNEEGVIVYATGNTSNIFSFYNDLIENPPKVSKIQTHTISETEIKEFLDFQIIPSQKEGKLNLQLTPDFAICDDCKQEISDSDNRRFQYPFTTCVNCGPRWAITKTFPFERAHTNMLDFNMCGTCQEEYSNISNRRFHSQTNSCPNCGIQIHLTDAEGVSLNIPKASIFKEVAALIKKGHSIAIKNTGGYLLCCDASNKEAIKTLRLKKNRPNKPLAILYPSLNLLKDHFEITGYQERALTSSESPIVIIPKGNYKGYLMVDDLAPNLNQIGVMLPYSGILQLLANELERPIVATSGNVHGSPIIASAEVAKTELNRIADYFLHHNLEIAHSQDDSVIKFSPEFDHKVIFRRSRGLAPNFFGSVISDETILAMGSHLKSTIAFLPNDYLYISQYLGNLDNFEVYNRFTETVSKFIDLFEQNPTVILTDAHPSYHSSQYGKEFAKNKRIKQYDIQHHKAHFASVLGEHNLFESDAPILGVVWDGTGYGDDGQIWGGEFFRYQLNKMERIAHFEYFDWLAADKMSKEPRLSLFSLADEEIEGHCSKQFSKEEWKVYKTLKKKNTLKTSSVGRLFDAVASLLNICHNNTYEGEAAILLENYVTDYSIENCKLYCSALEHSQIPTKTLLMNLYEDFKRGASKSDVIVNFIYTLANLVFQVADLQNLNHIALSGGVFQNTMLIDMLKNIAKNDYTLYFNCNLSPNDENISHGQMMYYLNIKQS